MLTRYRLADRRYDRPEVQELEDLTPVATRPGAAARR